MLREAVSSGSEMGSIMDKGKLVSDEVVTGIVGEAIKKPGVEDDVTGEPLFKREDDNPEKSELGLRIFAIRLLRISVRRIPTSIKHTIFSQRSASIIISSITIFLKRNTFCTSNP